MNADNTVSFSELPNKKPESIRHIKSMATYLFDLDQDDKKEEEQPVQPECFCNDYFYVGDEIDPSYEDAYFSITCADYIVELIVEDTWEAIQHKIVKKEVPQLIMKHSWDIFEAVYAQFDINVEEDHNFFECGTSAQEKLITEQNNRYGVLETENDNYDEECQDTIENPDRIPGSFTLEDIEPQPIRSDNWVRCAIRKYRSPDKPISKSKPLCFGPQDTTMFEEARERMSIAKESVKSYLVDEVEFMDKPSLTEIKYRNEIPSIEEQTLRALKDQQNQKNEMKARLKKNKLDNKALQNKRMLLQSKNSITYDYEGNLMIVKNTKESKTQINVVNFVTPVNISRHEVREINDPNLTIIPRAIKIDDPYKLPNLIMKKSESTKIIKDTTEKDPFDQIDVVGGVKFRYGNKEKINPTSPALNIAKSDRNKIRLSKDEYKQLQHDKFEENISLRCQKGPEMLVNLNKDIQSLKQEPASDVNASQTINLNENVESTDFRKDTSSIGTRSQIFSMKRNESDIKLKQCFITIKNTIKATEMLNMEQSNKTEFVSPDLKTQMHQKKVKNDIRNAYCLRGESVARMSNLDEFNLAILKLGDKFTSQWDASAKSISSKSMKLRPIKSDNDQLFKSVGENVKNPRDRNFQIKNLSRLDNLKASLDNYPHVAGNIFRKMK